MPGVVRVFTAADVPGNRGTGLNDPDQPVFVAEGEITCCVADFLAMVVADTQFHARQAAAARQGRLRGARAAHRSVRGAGAGRARSCIPADTFASETVERAPADHRLLRGATSTRRWRPPRTSSRRRFSTQPIEIAFLEPEACLAVPQGERRQGPHREPGIGLRPRADRQGAEPGPEKTSRSRLRASGGAFGAKEELSIQAQTAMAAFLLQRPVKTVLTREQSTQHHVKRHAMTIEAHGRGRCGRASARAAVADRRRMPAAITRRAPNARSAPRATRAASYRVPNVDVEVQGRLHQQSERAGRCAASAATRRSSPWKA